LFHAPASEVLQWADVERLEKGPGGAQRSKNETKIKSVSRFLGDESNTIPTAIILSLNVPEEAIDEGDGVLRFSVKKGKKIATVIDGQHRLIGMARFSDDIRVNVVALLTDDGDEDAFQFLVINNKAAKVSTDHIKSLLFERDNESLKRRLRKARLSVSQRYTFVGIADNDEESPFKGIVDWTTNRHGEKIVKPAAIETAIKDIQDRKILDFEDDDTLVEFFFTIWKIVKEQWPNAWNGESKLLNKVGIVCMTHYVTNSIVSSYDLGEFDVTDMDSVQNRVKQLLKMQQSEFWTSDWSSTSYDTRAGRKAIVDSLVLIARNVRHDRTWSDEVEVLAGE
jgi:DGQHR domain-containing protein